MLGGTSGLRNEAFLPLEFDIQFSIRLIFTFLSYKESARASVEHVLDFRCGLFVTGR